MRLEGSFYKVHSVESLDNSHRIEVEILMGHPIYEGHFPSQPVVPGVCTLTIIKECVSRILGRSVTFSSIKEAKYVSVLIPHPNLRIRLDMELGENGGLKASVVNTSTQQSVLKLRATVK